MTTNQSALTETLLEALSSRATERGDEFRPEAGKVGVRCLEPGKHQNGDAHPSAVYTLGKYLVCNVCDLKLGERRLADRLGIGNVTAGLTLTSLAEAKQLPLELLQAWGWRSQSGRDGKAQVLMPWFDERGVMKRAPAYHRRHYLDKTNGIGPRFTWDIPKGTKLSIYGGWRSTEWIELSRDQQIKPYVWCVESELDALTFWHHGLPAMAIGGATNWRDEWAEIVLRFKRILIAQEPGEPGIQMTLKIGSSLLSTFEQSGSDIRGIELLTVPFPEDAKDSNDLHLKVQGSTPLFHEEISKVLQRAIPVRDIVENFESEQAAEELRRQEAERSQLFEQAGNLLEDPGVLHKAIHAVEDLGVVGERKIVGLIMQTVRSRVLHRPINLEINSPSTAGKTHTVTTTLKLETDEAFYELTASSEKALVYLDEPLERRILFIQEPEGLSQGVGAAIIKSLVWEGRMKYDTVVSENGKLVGQHIEKSGPTGLIVTTTRSLEEQISNRMLRVEVDSSPEQTRRVLQVIARSAEGSVPEPDLEPWQAVSKLLGEPAVVQVPFASFIAERVNVKTLRIRRDFTHLVNLIRASTIQHKYQRPTSADGTMIATVADYATAHTLIADAFQAVQEEGITQSDRTMVQTIQALSLPVGAGVLEEPVSQAKIADHMGLSKSQVSYRVKRLLEMGYVTNIEERKGRAHKLVPAAPLPDQAEPLPQPCEVTIHLFEAGLGELVIPWMNPVTGEVHNCVDHMSEITVQKNGDTSTPWTPRTPEHCPRCKAELVPAAPEIADPNSYRTPRTANDSDRSGVRVEFGGSSVGRNGQNRAWGAAETGRSSGVRGELDQGAREEFEI